jgi:hypothetical protein
MYSVLPQSTLFIGFYNESYGACADACRAMEELTGEPTFGIFRTMMILGSFAECLKTFNPDAKWLSTFHSEAGVQVCRAIEMMKTSQKEILKNQFIIRTFGSPRMIPSAFALDVWNIASPYDKISLDAAKSCSNDPRYHVKFVQCLTPKSQWISIIGDHGILDATYQSAFNFDIRDIKHQYGFYNENNR